MPEIKLGKNVRRLREANGLSLRAVAEKSGFSASFLSQVENDQASPSITSMERIAAALGVTLGEFFQGLDTSSPAARLEPTARISFRSEWSKARIVYLAGGHADARILPLLVALDPDGSSGSRPYPALTEEFAMVLEGSVVLTTEAGEQMLGAGNAVTIPSGGLRRWHNASVLPARFLIVTVR
ncbi:MAG: helix-turn-helix domain-containing protein [Gemmatimonadales bacterium]